MPAVNLPDLRDLIDDLVRNPAHQVTPAQRERAIELALVRYSADRPREVVEDVVTADGATVPLPAGWVFAVPSHLSATPESIAGTL